jgi:hypothetical protein
MKKLINYFTPTTAEHKQAIIHFLAPLTAFLIVFGVVYHWFN